MIYILPRLMQLASLAVAIFDSDLLVSMTVTETICHDMSVEGGLTFCRRDGMVQNRHVYIADIECGGTALHVQCA